MYSGSHLFKYCVLIFISTIAALCPVGDYWSVSGSHWTIGLPNVCGDIDHGAVWGVHINVVWLVFDISIIAVCLFFAWWGCKKYQSSVSRHVFKIYKFALCAFVFLIVIYVLSSGPVYAWSASRDHGRELPKWVQYFYYPLTHSGISCLNFWMDSYFQLWIPPH